MPKPDLKSVTVGNNVELGLEIPCDNPTYDHFYATIEGKVCEVSESEIIIDTNGTVGNSHYTVENAKYGLEIDWHGYVVVDKDIVANVKIKQK